MDFRELLEQLEKKELVIIYGKALKKAAPDDMDEKALVDAIVQAQETMLVNKKDLADAIELANKAVKDELTEVKNSLEVIGKKTAANSFSSETATPEQIRRKQLEFIGASARAAWKGDTKGLQELQAKAVEDGILNLSKKALTAQTDANGGFLVPDMLPPTVTRAYQQYGFLEKLFTHWPMAGDTLPLPNTFNEAVVSMVGEKATGSASDLVIANPKLVAKKATAKYVTPNELIEDNLTDVDLGTLLLEKMEQAFNKNREQQMIAGSGSGNNHLGLFKDTAITQAYVLGAGKTAYTDFTIDDGLLMTHSLLPLFRRNAIFLMHDTVWDNLMLSKNDNGYLVALNPAIIRAATMQERTEQGLLGYLWNYPVYNSFFCPATSDTPQADKKFICFFDPFFVGAFGDKRARAITKSTEGTLDGINLLEADCTGWVGFERFAWGVLIPAAAAFAKTAAEES